MNPNRPDVAAILARKRILRDVGSVGHSLLTSQGMSQAFYGWPTEHIDYFCNVHNLVIWATPNGIIEARTASLKPPTPEFRSS